MASFSGLANLPQEILWDILVLISDTDHSCLLNVSVVNKKLHAIVQPLLVRQWCGQRLEKFALHLMHQPDLRRNVEDLTYEDFHTRCKCGDERYEDPPSLGAVDRDNLADAIPVGWSTLGDVNWANQIKEEIPDAIAALVLSWAINLKRLDLTISHFTPGEETPNDCIIMLLITKAVHQIREIPQALPEHPLLLSELRSVVFCHWDTEFTTPARLAAPFFWLPKLKSFHGFMLGWFDSNEEDLESQYSGGRYMVEFPEGTSSIEELVLEQVDLNPEAYWVFVRACRRLRSINISLPPVLENFEVCSNELASIVLHHADSLESVEFDPRDNAKLQWYEDSARGAITFDDCFQHLPRLKHPGVDGQNNGQIGE